MCTYVPDLPGKSPDRLDALVWACTELKGLTAGSWGDAYRIIECNNCGHKYTSSLHELCPKCRYEN